jgi:pantoate--beta-alanine ligase
MKIFKSVNEIREWRRGQNAVGFVPTMGALHSGHGSLVDEAKERGDTVLASIFVNPTQFNDPKDLNAYPRVEDEDLQLLAGWGADAVFLPTAKEIYSDDYQFEVREKKLSQELCGRFRPGHFEGVLTVVMKLFQIVQPERAYFGEKDFQQMKLIEAMTKAFFMPIEIVPCKTVREADGLAMSSRNRRLSPEARETAGWVGKVLKGSSSAAAARDELLRLGFQVDYVEDHWDRRLAAVHLDGTRLIDNVEI